MEKRSRATLEDLFSAVADLRAALANTPRLHRKDVLLRYGISKSTLHRRLAKGEFPEPVRIMGPLWRLADLEAAEAAGALQRPVSA